MGLPGNVEQERGRLAGSRPAGLDPRDEPGIAARILSVHPGLKPFEMKAILYWIQRARQSGSPSNSVGLGGGNEGIS